MNFMAGCTVPNFSFEMGEILVEKIECHRQTQMLKDGCLHNDALNADVCCWGILLLSFDVVLLHLTPSKGVFGSKEEFQLVFC